MRNLETSLPEGFAGIGGFVAGVAVIAVADTLSPPEQARVRALIKARLARHNERGDGLVCVILGHHADT